MNIPEGFVLVPADPIKAIDMGWAYLDAAREAEPNKSHSFSHAGYRAMIAAAPNIDLKDSDEAKVFNDLMGAAKEMLRIAGIANQGSSAYNRAIINLHEVVVSCVKSRARSAE